MTDEEAIDNLIKIEFSCFDKTENEGGRASCQDDYLTFYAMRKSQYLTWTREMIDSLTDDFNVAIDMGRNMVTEKYARMMESTAPSRYKELEKYLPPVDDEVRRIVDSVCQIEVAWMEKFYSEHPNMKGKGRFIHSDEDEAYSTSSETYLRGELLTYSWKTLNLYARHIAKLYKENKNIIEMTMENTIKMYGFKDFSEVV